MYKLHLVENHVIRQCLVGTMSAKGSAILELVKYRQTLRKWQTYKEKRKWKGREKSNSLVDIDVGNSFHRATIYANYPAIPEENAPVERYPHQRPHHHRHPQQHPQHLH